MKRSKLSMRGMIWMGSLRIMRMWNLRRDLEEFGVRLRMLMEEEEEVVVVVVGMVWCRFPLLLVLVLVLVLLGG
jgi:hypothetical protein